MYEKGKGLKVAEIDYSKYKTIAARLRKNLPPHVFLYIERIPTKKGKIAELYCRYPETAKKVIRKLIN